MRQRFEVVDRPSTVGLHEHALTRSDSVTRGNTTGHTHSQTIPFPHSTIIAAPLARSPARRSGSSSWFSAGSETGCPYPVQDRPAVCVLLSYRMVRAEPSGC